MNVKKWFTFTHSLCCAVLCCVRVTTYELMIYVASSKFLDPLKFGHHNVKLIETIQIIAGRVYLECNNLLHQISYSFVSKRKCAHCIAKEQGKILFKMHVHVITALMCCHIIGIITIRKSIINRRNRRSCWSTV